MTDTASTARRIWLLFLLAILLGWWAVESGGIAIPDAWNPLAPLQIDEPPNLLTGFKLSRTSSDPEACRAALADAQMAWTPLEDRVTGPGCGFENAVAITRSSVAVNAPFSLSCRAALSLAMWERHVLQQAAATELDAKVVRIEHFGSYACRNLYGRTTGARSQHASADALDIAAFVMDDGRRVNVVNDWGSVGSETDSREDVPGGVADPQNAPNDNLTPAARFLRAVHDGACRYFDAVLGPDYNSAHADHFHFDRGRARACR
ncbi:MULTISPECIES: extensin-like domain-containing protein [Lysobacteraceae]|uniref:Extensin family protein n=1 Tax=Novilysobacter avium TaxID=2781023 RepID=A0A7S6UKK5_9GAMM|nr:MULTISPECIES: extensin family protein [Lysobacter]QOW21961.1 extensin family protein [Lysobacter avium]QOW24431.1 extensin family protein [Lysobacter sp. H23M47]